MCQKCELEMNGTNPTEGPKERFASAGDVGVSQPSKIELHVIAVENMIGPAEVRSGEVVVDSDISVSHQAPKDLTELVSMVSQFNGCAYSQRPTDLLSVAADINVAYSRHFADEFDESELSDQKKEQLAKLIVLAIDMFTSEFNKGVAHDEVAEQLFEWTGSTIAEMIGDKVDAAILNVLKNMNLSPRISEIKE